jgi:uncharacterized membrane protein YphA (DoxX/SURF4 family)
MEVLFIVAQIVLGLYFVISGVNHFAKMEMMVGYAKSRKLPMPKLGVIVSGALLLLGGFGIALGVYTLWAVCIISALLVLISFGMHHFWDEQDPSARMSEMQNFMKTLALSAAVYMLSAVSVPWALSIF